MSQKQNKKGRSALFGSLRIMTVAALLAAMSFILGKFLQIPNPFSEIIRLSFENLPILFAGICFGPIVGAATGAVADLVGCLLYGYPKSAGDAWSCNCRTCLGTCGKLRNTSAVVAVLRCKYCAGTSDRVRCHQIAWAGGVVSVKIQYGSVGAYAMAIADIFCYRRA